MSSIAPETLVSVECERARALISTALDGELSDFEAAVMRAHLDACASCRAVEVNVRSVVQLLRDAPYERTELWMSLPLSRARLSWARAAQAAAIVLVLLAGASLTQLGSRHSPERTATRPTATHTTRPRPAYLDSPDYEQRLILQLSHVRRRPLIGYR